MPRASGSGAETSLNAQKQQLVCGKSSHSSGVKVTQRAPQVFTICSESEHCNALPCLMGALGSAGVGYLHRRGWKQDRAQKPTMRGLDQASFSLLGPYHTQRGGKTHNQAAGGTGRPWGPSQPAKAARLRGSHRHRGQDSTVVSAKLCQKKLGIFPV